MRQLGKAIGIIARACANESIMHEDISAWGAPSECHADVEKGEAIRLRHAHRLAKSVSGLSRRAFNKELTKVPSRVFENAAHRIYLRDNPFIQRK